MPYTGDDYVGDLALYYIAKKLESGKKTGSVDQAISKNDIDAQLRGAKVNTKTGEIVDDDKMGLNVKKSTQFTQDEISSALNIANRIYEPLATSTPKKTDEQIFRESETSTNGVKNIENSVRNIAGNNTVTFDFAPNKSPEVVIKESKNARDPKDVLAEAQLAVQAGVPASFDRPVVTTDDLGFVPGTPGDPTPTPTTTPTTTPTPSTTSTTTTPTTTTTTTTPTTSGSGQIINTAFTSFNNIPINALYWQVGDASYIVYEVPGSDGELYDGSPIYLAYELVGNDLYEAGLITQGMDEPQFNAIMDQAFFDSIAVVTGNTDQLTADIDNPFASFVETISEQAQVAPWITDPEMLELIAEAAVEGRTVSDAEWQTTTWYQTHSESEREWLRTFYADPSTAAQTITDGQIAVGNALQAAGVSNAPEALVNWIADKFVTGQWTQNYTTEQISLFADPYAEGKRDTDFESYLTSTAITGVDRTSQREAEVKQLYSEYLGPVLGKITDGEAAEIAGKLRNDPDYRDQLVASLKQSRLAAFSAYTNPELTYEDIARPWRNLTASVWGQTADETQGWWQDMVKTNDFAQAEETLRTKGLELDITQVTQDATTALTQALGQGNISQSGVNV